MQSKIPHLYPFESRYMTIGGLRLHYVDEGRGEPVVMVHGNPTWSFYFRKLITGLSPTHRVIAPDHIGCGLSEKPGVDRYDFRLATRVSDFTAFIERLELPAPVTLVVHDWGGMIGMAYAAAHPDRIGRVVILNTAAFPPPVGKRLPLRLRLLRNLPWLAEPAVLGLNLFAVGALFMAPKRPLPRAVRRALVAPYDRPRHRLATLKFVQDIPLGPADPGYAIVCDTADRLHRLMNVPMLICWGMGDFVFDTDYLAEWQRRFPDAEVHAVDTAGHYILEDEPEQILDRITDFVARHPLETAAGDRGAPPGDCCL